MNITATQTEYLQDRLGGDRLFNLQDWFEMEIDPANIENLLDENGVSPTDEELWARGNCSIDELIVDTARTAAADLSITFNEATAIVEAFVGTEHIPYWT